MITSQEQDREKVDLRLIQSVSTAWSFAICTQTISSAHLTSSVERKRKKRNEFERFFSRSVASPGYRVHSVVSYIYVQIKNIK